jgi:hypothetical protein
MPSTEARIPTENPSRYLTRLCQHASQVNGRLNGRLHDRLRQRHAGSPQERPEVRHVEWTDTDGTLQVTWGTCTLRAEPDALLLRADADDEADLHRLQDLLARDLERLGHRAGLTVTWHPAEPRQEGPRR